MTIPIRLESLVGGQPKEIIKLDSGTATFGRDPENTIFIDLESISRRHCLISSAGSQWIFRDLGSTNGSWINGVQIQEGRVRILRPGDTIQISEFPLRVVAAATSVVEHIGVDNQQPSILVFFTDRFEKEFMLETGSSFIVGGQTGDVFVDDASREKLELEIVNNIGRIELITDQPSRQVVVNTLVVVGTTVLFDRDEVEIGPYRFVINDTRSARSVAPGKDQPIETGTTAREVAAYKQSEIPSHLRKHEKAGSWESESSRRKTFSGRKFVFGSSPEGENVTETISMESGLFTAKAGFETNPAQRFSHEANQQLESKPKFGPNTDRLMVIIGVIIFVCLLIFLLYLFTY